MDLLCKRFQNQAIGLRYEDKTLTVYLDRPGSLSSSMKFNLNLKKYKVKQYAKQLLRKGGYFNFCNGDKMLFVVIDWPRHYFTYQIKGEQIIIYMMGRESNLRIIIPYKFPNMSEAIEYMMAKKHDIEARMGSCFRKLGVLMPFGIFSSLDDIVSVSYEKNRDKKWAINYLTTNDNINSEFKLYFDDKSKCSGLFNLSIDALYKSELSKLYYNKVEEDGKIIYESITVLDNICKLEKVNEYFKIFDLEPSDITVLYSDDRSLKLKGYEHYDSIKKILLESNDRIFIESSNSVVFLDCITDVIFDDMGCVCNHPIGEIAIPEELKEQLEDIGFRMPDIITISGEGNAQTFYLDDDTGKQILQFSKIDSDLVMDDIVNEDYFSRKGFREDVYIRYGKIFLISMKYDDRSLYVSCDNPSNIGIRIPFKSLEDMLRYLDELEEVIKEKTGVKWIWCPYKPVDENEVGEFWLCRPDWIIGFADNIDKGSSVNIPADELLNKDNQEYEFVHTRFGHRMVKKEFAKQLKDKIE